MEQFHSDSLKISSEENRIIPFTIEQLKEAQKQDNYANKIIKKIAKHKKLSN